MPTEKEILKLDSASIRRLCSHSLPQAPLPFDAKLGFWKQMHKTLTLRPTVSVVGGDSGLGSHLLSQAYLFTSGMRPLPLSLSLLRSLSEVSQTSAAAVGSGIVRGRGRETVRELNCIPTKMILFTGAQVVIFLP